MSILEIRYRTPSGSRGQVKIILDCFLPTTNKNLYALMRMAKMAHSSGECAERMRQHIKEKFPSAITTEKRNKYIRNYRYLQKYLEV